MDSLYECETRMEYLNKIIVMAAVLIESFKHVTKPLSVIDFPAHDSIGNAR